MSFFFKKWKKLQTQSENRAEMNENTNVSLENMQNHFSQALLKKEKFVRHDSMSIYDERLTLKDTCYTAVISNTNKMNVFQSDTTRLLRFDWNPLVCI